MNTAWQQIIAELDRERRRLVNEIVHYPPPIPRCDVQYNTLLEERSGVAQELYRAEKLSRELAQPDEAVVLAEFVRSSLYLSSETKEMVQSAVHASARAAATLV